MEVLTRHATAAGLAREWQALIERAGSSSPFMQPGWLLAWAAIHVRDGRLAVAALRRDGELVAVAPLHVAGAPGVRVLLPLGSGPGIELTELPGVVTEREGRRRTLGVLVGALAGASDHYDWARLTFGPADGWLEPHWLGAEVNNVSSLHHQTRACVVMPLAPTWEAQRATLKRNLRESLRRSRNRLTRETPSWGVRFAGAGPAWPDAVAELCRLHALRAAAPGRLPHPDWSADPAVARLLTTAAARLPRGALEIAFLDVDGVPIAAQGALSDGATTYLLMSGLDPVWWSTGAVTELVAEVVRRAIARGDRYLNLSSGPTVAKLRWSEALETHHDFVIVSSRARSRAAFAGYAAAAALRRFRRESRRFAPPPG